MKVEVIREFKRGYDNAKIEDINIDEYVLIISSLEDKKIKYETMINYKNNTEEEIIRFRNKIEILDKMIKEFSGKQDQFKAGPFLMPMCM